MPQFFRPTKEQYEEFFNKLKIFRKLSKQEIADRIRLERERRVTELAYLNFVPKHPSRIDKKKAGVIKKYDFEDVYIFERIYKNVPYYKNVVISLEFFSTFLSSRDDIRKEDVTRFVIRDSRYRNPVYYTPSIHRTMNYFKTCENYAKALIDRMLKYPCCENCGTPRPIKLMKLSKKNYEEKKLFSYYFGKCTHCLRHIKGYKGKALLFYDQMEEDSKKFLSSVYERYFKQREKVFEKTGSYPEPLVFKRSEINKKREGEMYEPVYNDGPHSE